MFLPVVEVDDLLGRGAISGVMCGFDEPYDRTVGSENRVLALCRPILNGKGGRKEKEGRRRVTSERKEKKTYEATVDTNAGHKSTTHTMFCG